MDSAVRDGQGLFTEQLRDQLSRRGLDIPFEEYDSLTEPAPATPAGRSGSH